MGSNAGMMHRPDYRHSLLNLLASISGGFGLSADIYPPLRSLPAEQLAGRSTILFVIDGLGYAFLQRFPDSFLYRHAQERLTSVFPSTTASAITSYFTGVAPQQHAITGWFTYFRELGSVATVLPFYPRHGGPGYEQQGFTPDQFIGAQPLSQQLGVRSHVIYPAYIVDSAYSRASCGNARRYGYKDMPELFGLIRELADREEHGLILAYWPALDSLAHLHGTDSMEVEQHFRLLDRMCAQHLPKLSAGNNILISADHGLINTDSEHTLHLSDHPALADTLTLPLCGEPRSVFCYVHADRAKVFEDYVQDNLEHACTLRRSMELLDEGYFGLGKPDPRLQQRIGDYTLLMKDNFILKDRLPNEKPFTQIGVHGGLSAEEMFIPLIIL